MSQHQPSMPYYCLEKNLPAANGTYIVQVLSLQGFVREAKAVYEQQKGFNLLTTPLKSDEFIKAWWQY